MDYNTSTDDQPAIASGNKAIAVSTVGYFCIAATWWTTGMLIAGWYKPTTIPGMDAGTLYAVGSILLVIIGILSLVFGKRVLDSIIFLATAGLFFSWFRSQQGTAGMLIGYNGWASLVWAVFFCYLWIASLRTGDLIRMLFLLLFWLGMLALALHGWTGNRGLSILGGYLLLITAILAFIVSAVDVLCHNPDRVFRKKVKTSAGASTPSHPGSPSAPAAG